MTQDELGVSEIQVGMSSLEDVFLTIAREGQKPGFDIEGMSGEKQSTGGQESSRGTRARSVLLHVRSKKCEKIIDCFRNLRFWDSPFFKFPEFELFEILDSGVYGRPPLSCGGNWVSIKTFHCRQPPNTIRRQPHEKSEF